MKNLAIIVMLVLGSGLFLTSCEKDHLANPLPTPGNSNQNVHKDGAVTSDSGSGTNSGGNTGGGITDSGRDEDYDKSGKIKGKKP